MTKNRFPGLIQQVAETLALELPSLARRDLVKDREDVLFVVLEIVDAACRFDRRPDRALEPVRVQLRFVAVELLGEGDDRFAIQRMGRLTLQVSENPAEFPKMSDVVIHRQPPNGRRPAPPTPGKRGSPAPATRPTSGRECTSVLLPLANSPRVDLQEGAAALYAFRWSPKPESRADVETRGPRHSSSFRNRPGRKVGSLSSQTRARLREWYEGVGAPHARESFGAYVARAAFLQRGLPYEPVAQPTFPEQLRVELSRFECVTFIESSLAVARCGFRGEPTSACFEREVVDSRYRGGALGDYASRLHYFDDWIDDNERRSRLKNLTARARRGAGHPALLSRQRARSRPARASLPRSWPS